MPPHEWITPRDVWRPCVAGHRAEPLLDAAVDSVTGLHYLMDMDDRLIDLREPLVLGFERQFVDFNHIRWACVNGITAIDLCAAALAQKYDPPAGVSERDLR
jgi:hypothetical protein